MATRRPTNDPEYRAYKRYLATHHVDCWYGCGRRATSPDHRPRLDEHTHRRGTGCCTLLPACQPCNSRDGAEHLQRKRAGTTDPGSGYTWP